MSPRGAPPERELPQSPASAEPSWIAQYSAWSRRPGVGALACAPLFVAYELGLFLYTDGFARNAADHALRRLAGLESPLAFSIWNALLGGLFLALAVGQLGRSRPRFGYRMLFLESLAWACVLAPATLILQSLGGQAVGLSATATETSGAQLGAEITFGIGAGLYEEILFRALLVGALVAVFVRGARFDAILTTVVALLGSAVLFSAYHHYGSGAEPYTMRVFVYRFLAGVLLGLLFVSRGLGVVVWTHALYDVILVLTADLGAAEG